MTLRQQSVSLELVPEWVWDGACLVPGDGAYCDGGAVIGEVLTPHLDYRDPAYAVREWPCPGCPMCEDPMTRG